MRDAFSRHLSSVRTSLRSLLAAKVYTVGSLAKDAPTSGVYLFTENGEHMYVGRSNRLHARLQNHARPSSSQHSVSFAFLVARELTGRQATYAGDGSRKGLLGDAVFARAFKDAKRRVGRMEVRFVREDDRVRQALLEIYAAVCLRAKYNSFRTH